MALIDSVNHGYGTDACLHYTLNDIMLQMTQVYMSWYLLATSPPGPTLHFFSKFIYGATFYALANHSPLTWIMQMVAPRADICMGPWHWAGYTCDGHVRVMSAHVHVQPL